MPAKNWPPPGYPLVDGVHALTAEWELYLPEQFARRIEDGSLVLWRPGLTLWLAAWGNDHNQTQVDRLTDAKERCSPARFAEREITVGGVTRFAYRLRDVSEDGAVESLNSLTFSDAGELQLSVYFDHVSDEAVAWKIVESAAVRRQA